MNVYSPLSLQKLASQKLLKDEALAISALKDLPICLFPVMLKEVFTNENTKILKAMIPMWPISYISLGMLINECNVETLKAMLEGLDILLEQKATTRCLKKPLETLCITNCDLSQADLDYLPYCLNIFELKCLQLFDIYLRDLFLEPLGFLLETVRDTLQTLELESCHIEDSQFNALMPVLSQCSHLIVVNFSDNNVSLLFLKQLLHHTAKMSQLAKEEYPAPLECYDESGVIVTCRLENFAPELLDILRAKRQPNSVTFETAQCSKCGGFYMYDLESQCCFFIEML